MVKDLSARLRSGSRTAVGALTRVSTNAESDAAAKRILSTVSEGDIIINSSYMQLQVLMNYVNYLHAADEQAQGRLSMYNNGGTHCGATNVTLYPASMSMQAIEDFVALFGNHNQLLIHVSSDHALEDVLPTGLLISHIANYVALPGNGQSFAYAYTFEIDGMSTTPGAYMPVSMAFPGGNYMPSSASIRRMFLQIIRAFGDAEGFQTARRWLPEGQCSNIGVSSPAHLASGAANRMSLEQSSAKYMVAGALFDIAEESNKAQMAAATFLEFTNEYVDLMILCGNFSAMIYSVRHLVLRAYAVPFFCLAVDAGVNSLPPIGNALQVRERAAEFVETDFKGHSDYGHAMRKAIADVFGVKLPESVVVMFSSVGGWQMWQQMPLRNSGVRVMTPGLIPIISGHDVCAKWIGYCDNENLWYVHVRHI